MLPAFARRPLLARMLNAAVAPLLSSSSSPILLSSSVLSSSSVRRQPFLPAVRRFANAASTAAPSSTSSSRTQLPSAADASAPSNQTSPASDAASGATPKPRKRTRRTDTAAAQAKARLKQVAALQRAKLQERLKKSTQRAMQTRMKKQMQRIVTQEKARERAALQKQKRQEVKDRLRAKSAHDKQQKAEERAVAQRYKQVRATRPKRPLSAFLAFGQSFRTSLPSSTDSARPSPVETTRLAAARWRELTADDKAKYEAQYKAALPAYEQAVQQWNEQQRASRPPVRPLNAYARYAQQRIKDIRAAEGGGAKASDLMKRIATEWKDVSTEEKDQLRQQVEADKAGYADKLKEWEARPADEQAMWRLQREKDRKRRAKRRAKTALSKQASDKVAGSSAQ